VGIVVPAPVAGMNLGLACADGDDIVAAGLGCEKRGRGGYWGLKAQIELPKPKGKEKRGGLAKMVSSRDLQQIEESSCFSRSKEK